MDARNDNKMLLGVPIGAGPLEQLVDESIATLDVADGQVTFACANPHSLVIARNNSPARSFKAFGECEESK